VSKSEPVSRKELSG